MYSQGYFNNQGHQTPPNQGLQGHHELRDNTQVNQYHQYNNYTLGASSHAMSTNHSQSMGVLGSVAGVASVAGISGLATPSQTGVAGSSSAAAGQVPQLWMGELDQRWDEATIKHLWSSLLANLGIQIYSVKLIKDKQSFQMGLNNAGYCFVRFRNFEDASRVLRDFNGKPIPGTNNQFFFRLNWSSANIQAAATAAAVAPSTSSPSSEYSIFVGDLPQNINEQILLQTFKSRYPSCSGVKIMMDQTTGNIKGYGFVKFLSEDDQHRALMEMQGYILLGRPIRVSTAAKSNSRTAPQNSNSPSPTLKPAGQQPPASLQYFNDPANTTVFIGGLNVPLTEAELMDLFSKFGDITYVKIPQGKNCGFVQYFHRSCAELAIAEMQGYDVGGGCKIRVSWGARAAQRNWFARQILMHQQPQQQPPQQQPPQQSSNLDLSTLIQLNPSQEMVNTLGLSASNLSLSDTILSQNGYALEDQKYNTEPIPFSSFASTTSGGLLRDEDLKLNSLLLNGSDVGFNLLNHV